MSSVSSPVLWHIPPSHYSEKVRWALDHKGVAATRRAPMPPSHMPIALWLTRGREKTFPVLTLDGESIGDSTAIIAALERRYPEPALYPEDPGERDRALALEDFFDEELGAHSRLLAFHHLIHEPESIAEFTSSILPGPLVGHETVVRTAGRGAGVFTRVRYGVSSDTAAETARSKILAAMDRLESELDRAGGEYLAGGAFSVADLTAASLFTPIVGPPEGQKLPEPVGEYEEFIAPLRERRGYRWVAQTFARHR